MPVGRGPTSEYGCAQDRRLPARRQGARSLPASGPALPAQSGNRTLGAAGIPPIVRQASSRSLIGDKIPWRVWLRCPGSSERRTDQFSTCTTRSQPTSAGVAILGARAKNKTYGPPIQHRLPPAENTAFSASLAATTQAKSFASATREKLKFVAAMSVNVRATNTRNLRRRACFPLFIEASRSVWQDVAVIRIVARIKTSDWIRSSQSARRAMPIG